jgi:phosphoglycolate phosphatase-like HAD superfamily hydrolase
MRRTNVSDPKTVAKVGDTPADLGEGDSAGCGWNVGVTYGTHVWAELVKHPHTALIEHLRDLPAVLGLVDNVRAPTRPDRPALRAGRVAE